MDEWEELFAKASGSQDVSSQEPTQQKAERKTSRKRKHAKDEGPYKEFLESRWEVATNWPMSSQCLQLGKSFDFKCSRFRAKDGFQCSECSKPTYEHTMYPSNSNEKTWCLNILCNLWDVRNASKSAALRLVAGSQIDWTKYDITFQRSQQSLKATRNEPLEPLNSYIDELLLQIESFSRKRTSTPYDLFSAAVKQMTLCDKVYYQLYYLQLTKSIPFGDNYSYFLPHPTEYFAAACYDIRALRQAEMTDNTSELNILGWDSVFPAGDSALHPLLAIHWYRRIEGADIFRGTLSSFSLDNSEIKLWKKPSVLSLARSKPKIDYDSKLEQHETLAPALLKEWRDSCRDFLCHLYAYATLNLSSMERIRSFLQEMKCSGITEIGAGTGYLARWLRKNGIKVRAYDIAPNGLGENRPVANEYHGDTPSFERVDHCNTEGRNGFTFDKDQALLLCYPPPDSLMARNALRSFLSQGGHAVIHVGEWKGLTGTREFENLLLANMKLVDRIACSSWGTDASEISFWERAKSSSLLIPCSACLKKEARKRCRLLRSLNYCSEQCCGAHQPTRDILFSLVMIDSTMVKVDFENDSIFQSLV